MINENIKVEKKELERMAPLPEDMYQVELADITVRSVETYNSKKDKKEPKEYENIFKTLFVVLDEDNRARYLFKDYVPSVLYIGKNGKNDLYQIIESLIGHELSPEEEATIDSSFLNSLVGKQCRVTVKHKVSGDNTYANIDTFLKAKEQKKPLTAEEKVNAVIKDKDETKEVAQDVNAEYEAMNAEEVKSEDIPF